MLRQAASPRWCLRNATLEWSSKIPSGGTSDDKSGAKANTGVSTSIRLPSGGSGFAIGHDSGNQFSRIWRSSRGFLADSCPRLQNLAGCSIATTALGPFLPFLGVPRATYKDHFHARALPTDWWDTSQGSEARAATHRVFPASRLIADVKCSFKEPTNRATLLVLKREKNNNLRKHCSCRISQRGAITNTCKHSF